jgi:hypothetical protein
MQKICMLAARHHGNVTAGIANHALQNEVADQQALPAAAGAVRPRVALDDRTDKRISPALDRRLLFLRRLLLRGPFCYMLPSAVPLGRRLRWRMGRTGWRLPVRLLWRRRGGLHSALCRCGRLCRGRYRRPPARFRRSSRPRLRFWRRSLPPRACCKPYRQNQCADLHGFPYLFAWAAAGGVALLGLL